MIAAFQEAAFASQALLESPLHPAIGMADCSLVELARRGLLVITDDLRLTAVLEKERLGVINLSRYVG